MTDNSVPESQSEALTLGIGQIVRMALAPLVLFVCAVTLMYFLYQSGDPARHRIKIGSADAAEALHSRRLHTILPLPLKDMPGDGFALIRSDPRLTENFLVSGYVVQPCSDDKCDAPNNSHPRYRIDTEAPFMTKVDFLAGYQIVGADRDESHFVVALPTNILGDMSDPRNRVLFYVTRSDMIKIIEEYRNVRASLQEHYLSAQVQERRANDLKKLKAEFKQANDDIRSVN